MQRVVHIEPKRRVADEDARTLESALAAHTGKDLTPADASAVSGLPLDAAEAGLLALASRFSARIRVSADGVLLFRFASLARERGPSRLGRAWAVVRRRVLEPLIAALTLLVAPFLLASLTRDVAALASVAMAGGWFGVVIIPCAAIGAFAALGAVMTFLVFIVLPVSGVALILAAVALAVELLPDAGGAGSFVFLLVLIAVCLVLGVKLAAGGVMAWVESVFRKPTWARGYWEYAVTLLLGPGRPKTDRLADERRLTALIRHRAGVLSLSDLIGLFRWTPSEADAQIARILCDYGGDVVATEDGAILYAFTDRRAQSGAGAMTGSLLMSAGQVDAGAPEPVARPRERFFPGSRAGAIALLAALGLGALGVFLHPALPLFPGIGEGGLGELAPVMPEMESKSGPMRLFGLGLWPYALLFGALLVRVPIHVARRLRDRARRRLERYLVVAAETPEGAPFAGANLGVVARLGGDYDGRTLSFPELALAKAAAARARAAGDKRIAPGEVVF